MPREIYLSSEMDLAGLEPAAINLLRVSQPHARPTFTSIAQ